MRPSKHLRMLPYMFSYITSIFEELVLSGYTDFSSNCSSETQTNSESLWIVYQNCPALIQPRFLFVHLSNHDISSEDRKDLLIRTLGNPLSIEMDVLKQPRRTLFVKRAIRMKLNVDSN